MRLFKALLALALCGNLCFAAQIDNPKSAALGPLASKLDHRLIPRILALRQKTLNAADATSGLKSDFGALLARTKAANTFLVEINGVANAALLDAIKSTGASVENVSEKWKTVAVSATLPQIDELSKIEKINFITLQLAPRHHTQGVADNHADIDQKADQVRALYGVDGTGQKIGVLSDTVNRSTAVHTGTTTGTVPNAFLSGTVPQTSLDLPASIQVVDFGPASGTDEGEGMLELIHDIAPGAALAFGSADSTQTTFAANISLLRTAANCTLTVDDVSYFAEPMFQDGPIAQAIKTNYQNNVLHFSAAGNDGDLAVTGVYTDSNPNVDNTLATPDGSDFHDWGIGGATPAFLPIHIPAGEQLIVVLQWDQPYASYNLGPGSQADLDLYLYRSPDTSRAPLAKSPGPQGVAGSPMGDPVEVLTYTPGTTRTAYLALDHYDGVRGNRFKIVVSTNGANITFPGVPNSFFNSGTIYGHTGAKECAAVGAIFYGDIKDNGAQGPDTTNINAESFSSKGGIGLNGLTYLFDTSGAAIPGGELRDKPDLAAPDGVNTSVFGSDSAYDADTLPNFFGTSCAAPNATAVAALLMQRFPGLKPVELLALMKTGARDIIANNPVSVAGPDDHTGAGLVDGLASSKSAIWNGGGSDNQFSTGPNWVGGNSPATGDNLFFKGTTRPAPFNSGAGASYGSILFATDGFTVSGSALTLTNVLAVANTSGTNTINAPITLGNFTVLRTEPGTVLNFGSQATINNAGNPLTLDSAGDCNFSAAISGAGSLTKRSGTGSVTLSAASTFSGGSTINAGTLFVNNTSGSATGSGSVTLDGRATLRGTGAIAGAVACVSSTSSIWPGITSLTTEALGTLSVGSADFASGSALTLRAANTVSGATPQSDKLQLSGNGSVLTLASGAALNLALNVKDGIYSNQYAILVQCTGGGSIQQKFSAASITSNHGWPIAGVSLVYLNGSPSPGNEVDPTQTPATAIALKFNGSVTPVTLESFTAERDGSGALIEWKCATELRNAGFYLWRRTLRDETFQKLNASLLPGHLTTTEPHAYRFYDESAPAGAEYRLECVSLDGAKEFRPEIAVLPEDVAPTDDAVSLLALDADISYALTELRDRRGKSLWADALKTPGADRRGALPRVAVQPMRQQPSVIPLLLGAGSSAAHAIAVRGVSAASRSAATVAKVVYSGAGVVRIPQSLLPAGFDAAHVSITREGRDVATLAADSNGVVLYGPGYQDDYTDKDVFFLSALNAPTRLSIPVGSQDLFADPRAPETSVQHTVDLDFHDVYFDWSIRLYNYPPWFSSQYLTPGASASFVILALHVSGGAAEIAVDIFNPGASGVEQSALGVLNGQPIGIAKWTDGGAMALRFAVPAGVLKDGDNTFELHVGDSATPALAFVHAIHTTYTRQLSGPEALDINVAGDAARLYEIQHLEQSDFWVVDTRGPDAKRVACQSRLQDDGSYTLRFVAESGAAGKFSVVPVGREAQPLSVRERTIAPPQKSAYLAVGPAQFAPQIQPLLSAHAGQGISSAFVDQETLFDAYAFGRYGPEGIRAAVRALKPDYLLLVGCTTYDYLDYGSLNIDPLCPSFFIATTVLSRTSSDAPFADLGSGAPEIAVGRLPVASPAELGVAVQRILAYRGMPETGRRALLVADRADPQTADFAELADGVATRLPEIAWSKAYLGVSSEQPPDITNAITTAANGGADFILYSGHGNSRVWGAQLPRILDADLVSAWTGNTILLQSTCNGNYFARNDFYRTISATAMTQPGGGAAASISTTTFMAAQPPMEFMLQLLRESSAQPRWGDALLQTQRWALGKGESSWYRDLAWTECLLGDPAMPIHPPPPAVPPAPASPLPTPQPNFGAISPHEPPAAGSAPTMVPDVSQALSVIRFAAQSNSRNPSRDVLRVRFVLPNASLEQLRELSSVEINVAGVGRTLSVRKTSGGDRIAFRKGPAKSVAVDCELRGAIPEVWATPGSARIAIGLKTGGVQYAGVVGVQLISAHGIQRATKQ